MCRIDLFVQTTSQTPTKWIYVCCSWVHKLETTWFQQSSQGPQHASQLTVADNWCLQKSFHDVPHPLEQTDLQSPSLRNWAPNTVISCHSHAYHWYEDVQHGEVARKKHLTNSNWLAPVRLLDSECRCSKNTNERFKKCYIHASRHISVVGQNPGCIAASRLC